LFTASKFYKTESGMKLLLSFPIWCSTLNSVGWKQKKF